MKITREQWFAKGKELFGDDQGKWIFVCPKCGNEASLEKAKKEWPQVKGRGWTPHTQCIGRHTKDAGCDWAAYGLFRGPVFVICDGEDIPVFDFAGKPYTSE